MTRSGDDLRFARPAAASRLEAVAAMLGVCLVLAACASQVVTRPNRTATEQILISAAIDRASENLAAALPIERTVFLAPVNFDGPDARYAVSAVRDALLRRGARVVDSRDRAEIIVELRQGGLSIDRANTVLGVPSLSLPFLPQLQTPAIAIFGEDRNQGVVKLLGTAYDPQTGELAGSTGPRFGFSNRSDWTVLLVIRWTTSDLLVDQRRPQPLPWEDFQSLNPRRRRRTGHKPD